MDEIITKKFTKCGVIRLNHHTNLQWLLEKDNFDKAAKLDWVLKVGTHE